MLECIEQEGFDCQQPVSDIAEIRVPPRFRNKTGSYICVPEGDNTKDSKPCQFVNNQRKDKSHLDQKGIISENILGHRLIYRQTYTNTQEHVHT